jgi:hypothetical protein
MICAGITKDWQRAGFPRMGIPNLGVDGEGLLAVDPLNSGRLAYLPPVGNSLSPLARMVHHLSKITPDFICLALMVIH